MSALPQPALKLDQYGRDPASPGERLRCQRGFVPLPYSFLADLSRLSSGQSCLSLILAIHAHGCWKMKTGWSTSLPLEDWAQLSCCDVRTVQRDRDYLKDRGMADVQVNTKREWSFKLRHQGWQALEDYSSWKAKQKPLEPEAEPETGDSTPEVRIMAGTVRLLKAPVIVKGGKTSRAWPVTCGVKSFQVCNPNSLDFRYDAVVQAGSLLITPLLVQKAGAAIIGEAKAKTVDSKDGYDTSTRHGCRVDPPEKCERPRAEELSALFDPLLLRSCHKSLSADTVALSEACEAVGETDHDFLVYWVIDRAKRPISSPKVCTAILRECAKNWEKHLQAMKRSVKRAECFECHCDLTGAGSVNGHCFACAEKKRTRRA